LFVLLPTWLEAVKEEEWERLQAALRGGGGDDDEVSAFVRGGEGVAREEKSHFVRRDEVRDVGEDAGEGEVVTHPCSSRSTPTSRSRPSTVRGFPDPSVDSEEAQNDAQSCAACSST
jgi:hypothetical protein